jgi:hypothetical protein
MEQKLEDALTCTICLGIATLPVHSPCCQRAKKMNAACLLCVRAYYELNKRPEQRSRVKKAYGGCGCTLYPKTNRRTSDYYEHTEQLDMIRDLFGVSKCPNCGVSCATTSELRRHISGRAMSNEKFGNCPEAFTHCKYCSFFGKRKLVDGEHYQTYHAYIRCQLCSEDVLPQNAMEHHAKHVRDLEDFRQKAMKWRRFNQSSEC